MLPPAATLNLHQQTQETDQLRGLVRLRRKEEEEMNYRYRAKPYIFGTADIHRITFLGRSNWWCSATAGNPNNTLTSRHYRAKLKKGLIRNSGLNHQDQCPKNTHHIILFVKVSGSLLNQVKWVLFVCFLVWCCWFCLVFV